MAGVFLSYARDDTPRARQIAAALEKAGHNVWWDLHVRGGTQFSKVIEEALNAADVVVVLWSAQSVESPWVRDEAATGRDRGRLVPVGLDGTEPPLGFRQFQTIDLHSWKGRGTIPRFAEILHAIDGAMGDEAKPRRGRPTAPAMPALTRVSVAARLAIITAVVFAAIAIAYVLVNRADGSDVRTVAITAANPAAKPIAEDLLVGLGEVRSVQSGSVRLLTDAGQQRPDLVLEARAQGSRRAGARLVLLAGKDQSLLWSRDFGQDSGTPADLKLQMAFTTGRILGCAIDGLEPPGGKALRQQTLRKFLAGCSELAEASHETMPAVIAIFEQVVSDAPRFKPGWAMLLLAESDAASNPVWTDRLRANLQRHIKRARELDPEMPEATLAEVTLLPVNAFGEALRLLDRAKDHEPDNSRVLGARAHALMRVGRLAEAITDAQEAARLDPASPGTRSNYVLTLAYAGRIERAREELQRVERLWAGTGRFRDLNDAFQLRFGDPKDYLKSQAFNEASPTGQLFHRTRADPTPANVERFMGVLRDLYSRRGLTVGDIVGHAQGYGELHREDDLYRLMFSMPPGEDYSLVADVLFRPSLRKFRQDPRFMIVAKRIGLLDYWTKSGKWPDFCFEPDQPNDCKAEAAKLS